jgi:hypothetical protein
MAKKNNWIWKRRFRVKAIKWLDKHIKRKSGEFWCAVLVGKIARGIRYEHMFKKLWKLTYETAIPKCPPHKNPQSCKEFIKTKSLKTCKNCWHIFRKELKS